MQLRLMQGQYQIPIKRTPKLKRNRRRGKMDHPFHLECLRFDLSDPKDVEKLRVVMYHTLREAKKRELRIRTIVDIVHTEDAVAIDDNPEQPVLVSA